MSEKVAITVVSSSGKEYMVWGFLGQSIYEALLLHNFDTEGSCAGRGTCGKCKSESKVLFHLFPKQIEGYYLKNLSRI